MAVEAIMAATVNFRDTTDDGQKIDGQFRDTVREGVRAALADRPTAETWEVTDCYDPAKDAYWFRAKRDGKQIGPLLEIPTSVAHTSVKEDEQGSSLFYGIRNNFRAYVDGNVT